MTLFRVSSHPLVRWWWSVDRVTVALIVAVMIFGAAVMTTASSGVAVTYRVDPYYFAKRQLLFLAAGLPLMAVCSMMTRKGVRNIGIVLFVVALVGTIATLGIGVNVGGGRRWIELAGFNVQPSEFLKPSFAVLTGWLMSSTLVEDKMRGFFITIVLLGIMGVVFMLQPNFGMFLVISLMWFAQMFLAGLSWAWLAGLMGMVSATGVLGYVLLPHVRSRIVRFLDPGAGDTYQVDQARDAFLSGGFTGRGPGEGVVKHVLPDAHTDFILAVIGEEFGIIVCTIILLVYAVIVWRCFSQLLKREDRFSLIACSGLLAMFSMQVLVNAGVALQVLPTTGMTLPFISYGGSSTLALSVLMGFVLALTRKGAQNSEHNNTSLKRRRKT